MKGCLNVTVNRIGEGINVDTKRAADSITASTTKISNGINILTNRIGKGIAVTCGLVCQVNKTRYLRVQPTSIFLMPGNNFTEDVLVISNIEWSVK